MRCQPVNCHEDGAPKVENLQRLHKTLRPGFHDVGQACRAAELRRGYKLHPVRCDSTIRPAGAGIDRGADTPHAAGAPTIEHSALAGSIERDAQPEPRRDGDRHLHGPSGRLDPPYDGRRRAPACGTERNLSSQRPAPNRRERRQQALDASFWAPARPEQIADWRTPSEFSRARLPA